MAHQLRPVTPEGLPQVLALVTASIRGSVAKSEAEAEFLIGVLSKAQRRWMEDPTESLHLGSWREERLVGVILVERWWKLLHLFVHPDFQRQGIGSALLDAVLPECRARSPRPKLVVNSSTVAVPFYRAQGFVPNGPPLDRPGGCVPLELSLRPAG